MLHLSEIEQKEKVTLKEETFAKKKKLGLFGINFRE